MIRLIIGFVIGVIISRNASTYSTPFWGSILLFALIGMFLFYKFGKRDYKLAVATAVAQANAQAIAQADAKAQAVASAAVQIFQMSGHTPTPVEVAAYVDHSREVESCTDQLERTSLMSSSEESSTKPSLPFLSRLRSQ